MSLKSGLPVMAALAALCVCAMALAQQSPSPPEAPPTSQIDPNAYVIGPGDTLQIFVWREANLSTTVPVRPDGKITTPLVEDMVAVGKTPSTLARDIETVLGKYIKSPKVNILVSQPVSAFSQVKIIGQVARPQSVPFREGMKVLDAVLAVGGLAPFAAGNRAKLMRMENGKQRQIRIKLNNLLNDGDLRQNLELRPGDVLVVPESLF